MAGASRPAVAPIVRGLPLEPQDRRSAFRCRLSDRGIENRLHPHDVPLRRNGPAPLTRAIRPACPPGRTRSERRRGAALGTGFVYLMRFLDRGWVADPNPPPPPFHRWCLVATG